MSSLAYGTLTRKREEATPRSSSSSESPGFFPYVDAFSALVPAEVIIALQTLLPYVSESTESISSMTLTITDASALKFGVVCLAAVSSLLYVVGRLRGGPRFNRYDIPRAAIPPAAFCGWLLLEHPEVISSIGIQGSSGMRAAIGISGGLFLSILAPSLAFAADRHTNESSHSSNAGGNRD